jgi:hypothetical protein
MKIQTRRVFSRREQPGTDVLSFDAFGPFFLSGPETPNPASLPALSTLGGDEARFSMSDFSNMKMALVFERLHHEFS